MLDAMGSSSIWKKASQLKRLKLAIQRGIEASAYMFLPKEINLKGI